MKQKLLKNVKDNTPIKLSKRGVTWVLQTKKRGVATITSQKGITKNIPTSTKVFEIVQL